MGQLFPQHKIRWGLELTRLGRGFQHEKMIFIRNTRSLERDIINYVLHNAWKSLDKNCKFGIGKMNLNRMDACFVFHLIYISHSC